MSLKEQCSIMMVTYNRSSLTKQTLDNLFAVTDYPFELIIVDNASSDDTLNYLNDFLKSVKNHYFINSKIISLQENKGIAIGRNIALKAADVNSKYLATIDNDVILPDNWLSKSINIISKVPKYGMIGVNFEGKNYPIIKYDEFEVQHKHEGNLGTACMVFTKQLHQMIGYFNYLDYGKYGLEDSDFGFRARVSGFSLGYIKDNGTHLGVGEHDQGEYREFKTNEHNQYLKLFYNNCRAYYNKSKPIKINFNYEI